MGYSACKTSSPADNRIFVDQNLELEDHELVLISSTVELLLEPLGMGHVTDANLNGLHSKVKFLLDLDVSSRICAVALNSVNHTHVREVMGGLVQQLQQYMRSASDTLNPNADRGSEISRQALPNYIALRLAKLYDNSGETTYDRLAWFDVILDDGLHTALAQRATL